jgi:hypothetical protein
MLPNTRAHDALVVDYAAVEALQATIGAGAQNCEGMTEQAPYVAEQLREAMGQFGSVVAAATAEFGASWQAAFTVLGASLGVVAGNAGQLVIDVSRIDDGIDPRFRL